MPNNFIESEVEELEVELEEEEEPEYKSCENCGGSGEIIDRRRINSRTIDVPYIDCPDCYGTGREQ